jgi:ornithine cyclodeaminase
MATHEFQDPGTRVFSAADVYRWLDLDTAYGSQVEAFRCLGAGLSELPDRLILPGGVDDALNFCYAARLRPGTGAVCKFGAVASGNAKHGLPTVHAVVLALDATTGRPVALLDGNAITELRTAAATAVAVDHLASAGARTLAVIGCGLQGRAHVRALVRARDIAEVRLWDHTEQHALDAAQALDPEVDPPVLVAETAAGAVAGADIVVTCTSSATPVLARSWIASGATVVSIGSFDRDRMEVPPDFVAGVDRVVVDHLPTALEQAGPVVAAIASLGLGKESIVELGDVVANGRSVRNGPHETVFYNSVGIGVQDAAATWAILERAVAR